MTRKHLIATTFLSAAIFTLAFSAMAQAGPKGKRSEERRPTPTTTSVKPQTSPTTTSTKPQMSGTAMPTKSEVPGTMKKQLDIACMIKAVEKRDTAVLGAFGTYYDATKSALQTRLAAFKAAWNSTDETARKTALKTAEGTFKNSSQKARKDLRSSQQQAWKQFKDDRKACGATGASEDTATEGLDAQL